MLKRPGGAEDLAYIGGLEFLKSLGENCQLVVVLPESVQDVPIGTEVWSTDNS
jgi:hypothetical protein